MPRRSDPARRVEVVDAAIRHAAEIGFAHFTLRGVAGAMGQSTRVVTHHFAGKRDLIAAMLDRLDDREQQSLAGDTAWSDPEVPVSEIVRAAWQRTLSAAELPYTALIHEIEGLGAANRVPDSVRTFVANRAAFVATSLATRGVPHQESMVLATMLNSAYTGLQIDFLTTEDQERTSAALGRLCTWIDEAVAAATSG